MDWVKLTTNYYLDAAIMRAGEAAEVLFTRALAYCGDQENGGIVPREVLNRLTPLRGPARARALVKEGLWEVVPGGWRFTNWDRHQKSREQMASSRETGRARQATYRRRHAGSNGVTNAVSDGHVTPREEEVEEEAAAAASRNALPPAVEILRAALEARKLTVRWDRLTAEQITEIEALIATHGDSALVKAAMHAYQPNQPAVYASAWLSGWRELRAPGFLALVRPGDRRRCPIHTAAQLTDSGVCHSCAADQKAGNS